MPKSDEIKNDIDVFMENNRENLINLCSELVEAKSFNPPGDTSKTTSVIEKFFSASGISCEIIAKKKNKPNLISRAKGINKGLHLLFNGHMDTIGIGDESLWSVPIFSLTKNSGRLYGIGMGNMKGAVAAMAMAYKFLYENRYWQGALTFTAVADETIFGKDGAEYLLEKDNSFQADAVICGEGPGNMNLAVAEKGVLWIRIESEAKPGQGMLSTTAGSANTQLTKFVTELDNLNDKKSDRPLDLKQLVANSNNLGLSISVNTGIIKGGNFISQLSTKSYAEVDIRIPPGIKIKDILETIDEMVKNHNGISYTVIKGWEANWTDPESKICKVVQNAAKIVRDLEPDLVVRLPASDVSRWRKLGIPGVCYGPQPLLASGVDDYVIEQDLLDCAKVYALASLNFLNTYN